MQAIDNLKHHGFFRSCPTSMVSITENMKATLLSSHKEAMLNTPFGRFFSLFLDKKIKKESMANQNRNLIFDIISKYSVEKDAFKFGEGENAKFVKFKPKHVALTFGIPVHGKKVAEVFRKFRFDPDQSSFLVKHNLQACRDIKRNVMKSKIESLMTEEGSENDFCRMIILFMSATIFFPNSNNSIGKSFVVHLENIENIRKLGWADLIYSELLRKVKMKKENPLYCAYVIPLLVWFCEITGVMEPRKGYIDGTPRTSYKTLQWTRFKTAELTMKTDPQNSDFVVECGASRIYEPLHAKDERKVSTDQGNSTDILTQKSIFDSSKDK
ncbi:hypothetical protein FRX31_013403, partial [Thalictrum thalictroides]